MVSSSNNVRRRRKCIWVTSIISGLLAIVIIAVTIKTRSVDWIYVNIYDCSFLLATERVFILNLFRHQIQTVAEALVRRDSLAQSEPVKDGRERINFRDYLSYKFYGHPFNGTWISDTEVIYQNQVCVL